MSGTPLEVFQFSSPNLFRALSNTRCDPDAVAEQHRAQYLNRYLHDIAARTIVVEHDYTDGDYLDDFASYYARCYADYDRLCKRLHFFADSVSEETLKELIRGRLPADQTIHIKESYLGFVVARPLPSAIVGRTVLKTYPLDNGRRNYTVLRDYASHLFGTRLTVKSLPFQEQDSVLAACATVALWCAFHKTAELFGTTSPRPAVITGAANRGSHRGRLVPSHGLIIEEMCQAVRDVGLEPELVDCEDNTVPLVSWAYGHLKMGLPVILIVEIENYGVHAITLTGYSLRDRRVHAEEREATDKCVPMVGLRIDEFYGHDDQIGPFSRLTIASATSPLLLKGDWKDETNGTQLGLKPVAALIPVYNKVRVTFLDVLAWLTRLNAVLPAINLDTATADDIEWDLSLTTTNEYKAAIKTMALSAQDIDRLLLSAQPRFIWRGILRVAGIEMMELLADATDMARSFPLFDVIWHRARFKDALGAILNAPSTQAALVDVLTRSFLDFLKAKL